MLIGIVGRKGSGKTTVSRFLEEMGFEDYSIATPLKKICTILGAPESSIYGTQDEKEKIIPELGMSGRRLMQQLGTDLFRNTFRRSLPEFNLGWSDSIWVHLLDRYLQTSRGRKIVVSDVRFLNEAEAVRRNNGILVRLERIGGPVDLHPSETELERIECDHVIINDGTKEELRDKIEILFTNK